MTRAVKPGRWVVLKHTLDEGETESYAGLHDWNFNLDGDRFVMWRPGKRIHADEHLPLAGRFAADVVEEDGYRWVRVGIQRATASSEPPAGSETPRRTSAPSAASRRSSAPANGGGAEPSASGS
jgi:hypothetical protein